MPIRRAQLVGETFGLLKVLSYAGNNKHSQSLWKCRCACGRIKIVSINALRGGMTRSCGCLRNPPGPRKRTPGKFTCTRCKKKRPLRELLPDSNYRCVRCGPSAKHFNLALRIWRRAKKRASTTGVPFTISPQDVEVPDCCPVFGRPFRLGVRGDQNDTPSLDRIDASKGYIPGNVCVISWRANTLKRDATLEELEQIAAYVRRHLCK